MNTVDTAILVIAALLILFLWAIHPEHGRKRKTLAFAHWNYAHRGLWDMEQGIPENSLPAFARAVKNRFAIELDVHLTNDGKIVVFHDDTLDRMCKVSGTIEEKSYAELSSLSLAGTRYHIPLLTDVLALVDGKVPLLIELKLPVHNVIPLCRKFLDIMKGYSGKWIIESFNPFGLQWFRKNRPEVIRGQLSSVYPPSLELPAYVKAASTSLVCNALSRPDFISYNYKHTDRLGFRLNRHLFRTPIFVWTVRNAKDFHRCRKAFDSVIFERFIPALSAQPEMPES